MDVPQYKWAGRLVGLLAFLIVAAYVWFTQGEDIKVELGGGYSLAGTLPEMIDAEGRDKRVVSLLDSGGDVSFEVLTDDGRVLERFFGRVCTSSAQPGGACSYQKTRGEHPASGRERKVARTRLGDIDPKVPDRLRKQAGVRDNVRVGLRGTRWVITGTEPFRVANLDGSNLHKVRSPAERALAESVSSDAGAR